MFFRLSIRFFIRKIVPKEVIFSHLDTPVLNPALEACFPDSQILGVSRFYFH